MFFWIFIAGATTVLFANAAEDIAKEFGADWFVKFFCWFVVYAIGYSTAFYFLN